TYLALIFGTLLSSQGTVASFVLTLSGFPPGASLSVFQTLSGFFRLSDHPPANMQKEIQRKDLTSLGAAGARALSHTSSPPAGVRLYTGP
ncbi:MULTISPECIES: hypothetical protein, partial [unclassified Streptomyces]|uniref:hypothetical protein n=1 Tax=unclassified Streptomyces TaxID=2593676 RepID=UPI001F3C2D70